MDFKRFGPNQCMFMYIGYGALAFTERLSIWCPMIQGLSSTGFGGYGRYVEIVHLLITGILRKMQYRFDQDAELDVLDNECLDDNVNGILGFCGLLAYCFHNYLCILIFCADGNGVATLFIAMY